MHLKTHFKFLFNSSKISTSYAHVIFFLNTRLHCESTKIWIRPFGSTHLELQNSQTSIKICINELSYLLTVTGKRGPHVSGSACQQQRSRARCQARRRPAKLADGGVPDDGTGTNTFTSTSRVYRPTWLGLLPATKMVAAAMAVRWFGSTTRHRRRLK